MKNPIGIGDASSYDTNKYTDWTLARHHGAEFGILRACTTGAFVNGKPSIVMDILHLELFLRNRCSENRRYLVQRNPKQPFQNREK